MNKHAHVTFTGSVQGVGFRFTIASLARRLGVVGWVSNLDNGDVALEAEASQETLDKFFDQIKEHFPGHIAHEDIAWSEATGSFLDFTIRF